MENFQFTENDRMNGIRKQNKTKQNNTKMGKWQGIPHLS